MTEINAKIEILKAQIEQHKAFMQYWQTVILSGSYENRRIYHGMDGDLLSKAELLDHHINIMNNHTKLIAELTDNLIKHVYEL